MKNLRPLCLLMYFIFTISKQILPVEPLTSPCPSSPSTGHHVCHKGQETDPVDSTKLVWTNNVMTCVYCDEILLGGVNIQAANRIPLSCDHQNAVTSGGTPILATTPAKGTTTSNTLEPGGSTNVNSGMTSSAAVTSAQITTIPATTSTKGTTTIKNLGSDGSTEVNTGMTSSLTVNTAGQSVTSIGTTGQSVTSAGTTGPGVTSTWTTGPGVTLAGTIGQSMTSAGTSGQGVTSAGTSGQGVTSVGTSGQGVPSAGATGQDVTSAGTTRSGMPSAGTIGQGVTSAGTTGQGMTSAGSTGQNVTSVGTTEQSVTSVGTSGQSVISDSTLVTTTSGMSTMRSSTTPGFNLPTLPPLSPLIFGDCSSALAQEYTTSGIYLLDILAGLTSFRKWCDMESDGGGWLVFQRRQDGSVHFNRTWQEYTDGFGSPDGEYWMGNEALSLITSANNYELRIDMEDWEGNTAHATYKSFKITGEKYTMDLGQYSNPQSTAGDSLGYADGRDFSTIDRDNDNNPTLHCMEKYGGGWWTNNCYDSNLNCYYRHGPDLPDSRGIVWFHWKGINYAIMKTEMKIRRI